MKPRSTYRFAGLPGAMIILLTATVNGQVPSVRGYVDEGERQLPVDYAAFASDTTGQVRLEVYFQVSNRLLRFEPVGDVFEAQYEVTISVRDNDGREVVSRTKPGEMQVSSQQRALAMGDFRIRQETFDLAPGKYEVKITLRDKNSEKTIARDIDVKLKDPIGRYAALSDVELVHLAELGAPSPSSFTKGNLNLVPSVSGRVGGSESPRLLYYLEIYRGRQEADDVLTVSILRTESGKMVYRDSLTVALSEWRQPQLREISLTDLRPGAYVLEVLLRGRRDKKLDEKHKEFFVVWTAEATARHSYDAAVDQLTYIASGDEIDRLRSLRTLEERTAGLEEFWRNHDPTPGTPENELRHAFYQRVTIANERFAIYGREGWRTDRGRIYIQYGEPDQIDDYPMSLEGYPYQRWYYYSLGPYRVFTFVDQYEDGDYRLLYPYDGIY